jgi:hypothetical protein
VEKVAVLLKWAALLKIGSKLRLQTSSVEDKVWLFQQRPC